MSGRRFWTPNVAALLALVLVAAALLVWQRPWTGDDHDVVPVPADADRILKDQFAALSDASTRAELRAAAGPGADARRWADDVWDARRSLGVDQSVLRYVEGGEASDRSDGTVGARVKVSWRLADDSALSSRPVAASTVQVRLAPTRDGGFSVRSVARDDGSLPLWLAGSIRVVRGEHSTLVEVDGGIDGQSSARQVDGADRAVRRLVPTASGRLVVVAPHQRTVTAALLDRSTADVRQIAAVTTTLDGTATAPQDIVLNPTQFASMDERASQVVLTHEATHLLTGSVGTDMPAWVAEGFADFVALARDDAPLSVSAGQALQQVKDGDLPKRLPTAQDFAGATHLGAVYEQTWLAFRMLGERYGERRVVEFYTDVRHGTTAERALQSAFGLDEAQLTRQWRAYLTKMASTVS